MNATQVPLTASTAAAAAYQYIPLSQPFYYSSKSSLLPWISDIHLSLAAPVVAYWAYSLFFHALDQTDLLAKYRLHEPEEVTSRNKVSIGQVVKAVLVQHFVQTLLGLLVLDDTRVADVDQDLAALASAYGPEIGKTGVYWLYWWIFPAIRILFGTFVMDTWQYTLHRAMHTSPFLYRQLHSVHHRLYVPYAFGALYNHPLEGILLDTLGAALSSYMAGLSVKEDIFFFTVSQLKTVDDHCGYAIPWDPLQMLFGNNAEYHDIHHQKFGIKKNFSQPFFTHWDSILGTRMTKEEAQNRPSVAAKGDLSNDEKED